MPEVVDTNHKAAAMTIRKLIADYREVEELVSLGAYQRGTTPRYDRALAAYPDIEKFLCQDVGEHAAMSEGLDRLYALTSAHGGAE
jgi:flagellum-specific ATP synthase